LVGRDGSTGRKGVQSAQALGRSSESDGHCSVVNGKLGARAEGFTDCWRACHGRELRNVLHPAAGAISADAGVVRGVPGGGGGRRAALGFRAPRVGHGRTGEEINPRAWRDGFHKSPQCGYGTWPAGGPELRLMDGAQDAFPFDPPPTDGAWPHDSGCTSGMVHFVFGSNGRPNWHSDRRRMRKSPDLHNSKTDQNHA